MKAIILNEAGDIDKLVHADIPKPTLKAGQILIKTKTIGINPMDVYIRNSEPLITSFLGAGRPAILGWDVAGDVVEMAPDITGFNISDAVFGLINGGGYAEYVAIRADLAVPIPANSSYNAAAAVPVAAITAWQALVKVGRIKKGDHVLIHAGAGGVGHFAIQIAKHIGATVVATSSARNRDFVLSQGADRHIDYTTEKFDDVLSDMDLVLDSVGHDTLDRSVDIVRPGGAIVTIVPPIPAPIQDKARERGVNLSLVIGQEDGNDMRTLGTLLAEGVLRPHIAAVYPFADMAAAHTAVATRRTAGKIVVQI